MNSNVRLELNHITKQSLLFQLEHLATLLLCNEISFYSNDARKETSDGIDGLVLILMNLTVESAQQNTVNGIDDLVVEITLELQEGLVELLNKNKNLLIVQKNNKLIIQSMNINAKQKLARSNKDMCRKLQDLPIKSLKRTATTTDDVNERACTTQHADTTNEFGGNDEGNELKVEKSIQENVEDETTLEFKIGNLEQKLKELSVRENCSRFHCNQIPWFLQFRKYPNEDDQSTEISVSLFCDYNLNEYKGWFIKANFELLLLSHIEGIADKRETLNHIFTLTDDGLGYGELDLIGIDDLRQFSPFVKDGEITIRMKLKTGPLIRPSARATKKRIRSR